ncbi:Cardiolipin synthase (CMP-forming) [Candida viswanathii]|uniref:Cardiolipin synthase (CMP-forming) n=1 Tax=Candida viswanathii TaxID=5486 RepID=A0A367XS27_9ASCO|nr:Cardiolipin synthase (CMP-forming) [Candida viswanathii]
MLRLHPAIKLIRGPQVGILRSGIARFSTKPTITSSLWTIPNVLTYTRILTTPAIGYYIVSGESTMALLLFTYSCVTDFIDGFIARRFNMKSVVGSIIDPLADKFLMTVCTLSLGYVHAIPPVIASIIIGRDVMLSFMSFYYRYKSLPRPRTFDKFVSIGQVPTISVHPNLLGKANTALQMLYIGSLVYRPLIELVVSDAFFDGFGLVVGATTLLSGPTTCSARVHGNM